MSWRLSSSQVRSKLRDIAKPDAGATYAINRNPRNLEKLRIAYKPDGYHLDRPGRCFWHTLRVNVSKRYVTADVVHFENGTVISASSGEWALQKQLYKYKDTAAFVNVGRVLAHRCLQSGILEMTCNVEATPGSKLELLLKNVEANGVSFNEPARYKKPDPWGLERPEKPWEVLEDNVATTGTPLPEEQNKVK